ncbi:hypothetical protein [Enterobacter sp. KB-280D8]
MADYGAYILMDNGNPFVTPYSTPFCLYNRSEVASNTNGSAAIDIPVDPSYPAIAFCRVSGPSQAVYLGVRRNGSVISASASTPAGYTGSKTFTLTVYVFAVFPQPLPQWGIAFWDASGRVVLTNESRVLTDLVTVGTPGAGGINLDVTLSGSYAVAPGILGSSLWQTSQGGQPVIINVTAYTGCYFNGITTRFWPVGNQISGGTPAGGTTTGITLTAINTAAYD